MFCLSDWEFESITYNYCKAQSMKHVMTLLDLSSLIETMANVDEVLGEMFLEEVQRTEEQLMVSRLIDFG